MRSFLINKNLSLYLWEEYSYGLKFVEILNEDHLKLRRLLRGRSNLEEPPFMVNNSGVSI
jgi:hypothetical protein